MKKILLTLFVCFISLSAFAQEHLKFKGIELNVTEDVFVQALLDQGFTLSEYDELFRKENVRLLDGTFAGIDKCSITILFIPSTKIVCKVTVSTPSVKSWNSILSQYNSLAESFKQKYASYKINEHKFFERPYEEGDGYELQAIDKEKCHYGMFIYLDNGTVGCMITSAGDDRSPYVNIAYEDEVNFKAYQNNRKAVIQSDL